MSVLEKDIENAVVQWAIKQGFLAPKVKFTEAGWPDRLFLGHGASIFIEFKRPGEQPDKLQEFRIEQLNKRGIPAYWCDSFADAISILTLAMDSPSVSGEGNKTDVEPGSSRVVSGPWAGEDVNMSRCAENFTGEGFGQASTNYSPVATNVQRLAERDKEVGELQQLDLFDSTRLHEGSNAFGGD